MPPWLQAIAAVFTTLGGVFLIVRYTVRAELRELMREHTRDCPARGRAVDDGDDSGAVTPRTWSPSSTANL